MGSLAVSSLASVLLAISLGGCGEPTAGGLLPDTVGSVRVIVRAGGVSVPRVPYQVKLDGMLRDSVAPIDSVDLVQLAPGPHDVELAAGPTRCAGAEASDQRATVTGGKVTTLVWNVTCTAPEGGRILFVRTRASGGGIVVMDADGSNRYLLMPLPGGEVRYARWSPNGSRIAVDALSDANNPAIGGIWIVHPDGAGSPVRVTTGCINPDGYSPGCTSASGCVQPAWSPDGSRLACWRQELPPSGHTIRTTLHLVALADGRDTVIADGAPREPDWSPDGHRVLYTGSSQYLFDLSLSSINLLDLGTGEVASIIPFTATTAGQLEGAWSPDGTRIAFTSASSGYETASTIEVISTDGTGRTLLESGGAHTPRWSPDGKFLIYESGRDIYRLSLASPAAQQRLTSDGDNLRPDWAPQ
jgi:Tol biopolymer transport system component